MASRVFDLFPQLACELRQKIWLYTIIPRMIPILLGTVAHKSFCRACAPLPIALHVCHESRQEALFIYTLCSEKQLQQPIYFSSHHDTLLFDFFSLRTFNRLSNYSAPENFNTSSILDPRPPKADLDLVRSISSHRFYVNFEKKYDRRSSLYLDLLTTTFLNIDKLVVILPSQEGRIDILKKNARNNWQRWQEQRLPSRWLTKSSSSRCQAQSHLDLRFVTDVDPGVSDALLMCNSMQSEARDLSKRCGLP